MNNRPGRYTMSSARLQEEGVKLIARPKMPAWINPTISVVFLATIAILVMIVNKELFLFGVIMLIVAVGALATYPVSIAATFDLSTRSLHFIADYLVRSPRRVEIDAPLSQIVSIGFRPTLLNKKQWVEILLADGNRIVFDFGRHTEEAERLVNELKTKVVTSNEPVALNSQVVGGAVVAGTTSQMQRELRSWGFLQIFLGVMQMVSAGGFSSWGLFLIVVGLASFYFREAPMFMIYATAMAWAGVSNIFSGNSLWIGFALLQGFWTFRLVRQFRTYQLAEATDAAQRGVNIQSSRTGQLFPMLSIFLGLGGFAGIVIAIIGSIFVASMQNQTLMAVFGWLEVISVYCALIGLAMGIASGVSRYSSKPAWIAAIVFSSLTLLIDLGLRFLASISG